MKNRAFFFKLYLLLLTVCAGAQTRAPLGQNEFDNDVLNQWWSYEDKSGKGDCDMRILNVRPGEFEVNCVNWTNGFSGSVCSYSLDLVNDYFRLSPRNCGKTIKPGYVYGYLGEGSLYLLFSPKPLVMDSALQRDKNWTRFSKIRR